ncbi:MAG: hypothetical protein LBG62_00070 [Candidatus Methanoplasma sp.]|jgi:hypothetical protein|nr:hypothetical protein [Candidatus Methanoplasma sp.]
MELTASELWGMASLGWVLGSFGWAVLRGHALKAALYGGAMLVCAITALNAGGVVDAESVSLFGAAVFGAEALWNLRRGRPARACGFAAAMAASLLLG